MSIIGTHNSMTFQKPAKWYGWLMIPFARCQSKDIEAQFNAGARCFDLRVRFDEKDGLPYFAHGLMRLGNNVVATLSRLQSLAKSNNAAVYVRLILEDTKSLDYNATYFADLCKVAESVYGGELTFFGGNRKGDWKQIYTFDFKPTLYQRVGSMAEDATLLESVIPWLYAALHNDGDTPADDGITIYDFI